MESRKAARTAAQPARWEPLALWSNLLDLPRQQSAAAAHAARAIFSGFEAIRKIQEKAAHRALKHYTDAAGRLQGRCAPADVLSVQMELAQFDVGAAMAYWQQIADAVLQAQAGVAACACELVESDQLLQACADLDHVAP
jgi:hypothetical protein